VPPVVTLKRFILPLQYICLFHAFLTVNIYYFRTHRPVGLLLDTDRVFCEIWNKSLCMIQHVGRDISVGTATRYGLDGPGIESRWGGEIFRTCPDRPCDPHRLLTIGTGSFTGVKRPGHGVDHTTPCSAEVKERVVLYLYSHSGPSWPVLG